MRFGPAVALIGVLALGGPAGTAERAGAVHLGTHVWRERAPWFGGFSGIEISDDGREMLALSDRATLVSATLGRTDGRVSGVKVHRADKLRSSGNKILKGRSGDSEGLALAPGGGHYISFEGAHRLAHFGAAHARSTVMPQPAAFRQLAPNGSFEPLAIDRRGYLYTMPESSRVADGSIPVYRWDGRRWSTPFTLPQRQDYLPVGADFGPDGRLYLLERATRTLGFRSRIRRWDMVRGVARNEQIILQTSTGTHQNLEGLAIWRDAGQRLRATMISDDNFLFLLRTEIVEYALPD